MDKVIKKMKYKRKNDENNEIYLDENKYNLKQYCLEKKEKKREQGYKYNKINEWKRLGIDHNDLNELYDNFINTKNCMYCNKEFTSKSDRRLNYDDITHKVRFILCNKCNKNNN